MSDLDLIAQLPAVKSAVLGDLDGAYLDALREHGGEPIAAVAGFIASTLLEAGESLGLGNLGTVALSGPTRACLVVVRGSAVITAAIDPPRSLSAVEKAVDATFQEWA